MRHIKRSTSSPSYAAARRVLTGGRGMSSEVLPKFGGDAKSPKLVQIIHRHGDRVPITSLGNADFWSDKIADCKGLPAKLAESAMSAGRLDEALQNNRLKHDTLWGRLTTKGCSQMRAAGFQLRKNLHSNFGLRPQIAAASSGNDQNPLKTKAHNDSVIWVSKSVSTPFHRTVLSLQEFLHGLLDDDHVDSFDLHLNHGMDPFWLGHNTRDELERLLAEPEVAAKEEEMKAFREKITETLLDSGYLHPDEGPPKPLAWPWLFEITHCLETYDILPSAICQDDMTTINQNLLRRWNILYRQNPTYLKKVIRPFHDVLRRSWESAAARGESSAGRIEVYSAHDSTVFALLNDLELTYNISLFNPKTSILGENGNYIPPYASTVCLALYQKENCDWWVSASFSSTNGGASDQFKALNN